MFHYCKMFMLLTLVCFATISAEEKSDHLKFVFELKIDCPPSKELQECMNSVPTCQSKTFEEWRDSLVKNLKNLIILLESGKIHGGQWSVQPDVLEAPLSINGSDE